MASHEAVIVSRTNDAEWQHRFAGLPFLALPTGPLLVVAPHPDDETLGAGALIWTLCQQGVRVTVVAATDGENAYNTPAEERRALAHTRDAEQREALTALGVPADCIHRLRLTDSGLHTEETALAERLLEIAEPGMTLLAPWSGDFHPDHEACARAAATVAHAKSLQLFSYFFWTWHRGRPDLLDGLPLCRFDPPPEALAAKTSALAKHRSQLHRDDEEPILPERLLGPARWSFEVFLVP